MFEGLQVLRVADQLARHAEARQGEISRNIANADTPGFRAGDLPSFADSFEAAALPLRSSRPQHLPGTDPWQRMDAPDQASPDGNTVSLEEQILKAAETRQSHDMALTVYSTTMAILRTSLGGRR